MRRVFYIDVGDMDEDTSINYLRDILENLKVHSPHTPFNVLLALDSEEEYCKSKWNPSTPNGRAYNVRSVDEWILYMEDYIAQARNQSVRGDEDAAMHTVRKVTNLGVNAMKQWGAPLRTQS